MEEGRAFTCILCAGLGRWGIDGEIPDHSCEDCGGTGRVNEAQHTFQHNSAERTRKRMLETIRDWRNRN